MIPSERVCQEEQNGANFNSVAPSVEELWVWKEIALNALYDFRPQTGFCQKKDDIGKGTQSGANCSFMRTIYNVHCHFCCCVLKL